MTDPAPATTEVTTVGVDLAVLHRGVDVRRFDDLAPGRHHDLDGVAVRTLDHPGGELLARIATVNDVHFGETRCGVIEGHEDTIGPILTTPPGETPYPTVMNEAAVAEIDAAGVDLVVAKGDLTADGLPEEYQAFLDTYGRFGDRLIHVRGNHDAFEHQAFADTPVQRRDLPGATVVLLDTTVSGRAGGNLRPEQIEEVDQIAADADRPVLLFGHHHIWDPASHERPTDYYGIQPDASEALIAVAARRPRIAGYFAGHTHRNRVLRLEATGPMPWAEVACVKDFPGTWAEYQVHEGGVVQVHHRISSPAALAWTEQTRHLYNGHYAEFAFGSLTDRCFPVER